MEEYNDDSWILIIIGVIGVIVYSILVGFL